MIINKKQGYRQFETELRNEQMKHINTIVDSSTTPDWNRVVPIKANLF